MFFCRGTIRCRSIRTTLGVGPGPLRTTAPFPSPHPSHLPPLCVPSPHGPRGKQREEEQSGGDALRSLPPHGHGVWYTTRQAGRNKSLGAGRPSTPVGKSPRSHRGRLRGVGNQESPEARREAGTKVGPIRGGTDGQNSLYSTLRKVIRNRNCRESEGKYLLLHRPRET